MDNVLVFQLIFLFLSILPHSYSQTTGAPAYCSQVERTTVSGGSSAGSCGLSSRQGLTSWKLDLNATFFVNSILVEAVSNDPDSVSVDVGTTSCNTFQLRECYVPCFSRQVMQKAGCYVTIKITCNVPNVKGRYLRVRQNRVSELELCGVKVMGDRSTNRGPKNYALKARCWQNPFVSHYGTSNAVDGKQSDSCSVSRSYTTMFHWWLVDLGRTILVSKIIISSTDKKLENFDVDLGRYISRRDITYYPCFRFSGVAGAKTTLNCTQSIWGQFVRVSMTGQSLVLCEVEVYGDADAITPVSDLISNFTWSSIIKYEENATSLETLEENLNSSSVSNTTDDISDSVEMVTGGPFEQFVDDETNTCSTCNCHFPVPKSPESVQQEVKEAQKELKVETKEMSQQVRKKTSVPDQRMSSQAVGLICVVTISSIFTVIVACDVCRLFHYLLHRKDESLLTK